MHGSQNGWYREAGDYPATVKVLLGVGARLPETIGGTDVVKEVLRQHGLK
jgi:hypothetical protein